MRAGIRHEASNCCDLCVLNGGLVLSGQSTPLSDDMSRPQDSRHLGYERANGVHVRFLGR
jgi:hypothetical protein